MGTIFYRLVTTFDDGNKLATSRLFWEDYCMQFVTSCHKFARFRRRLQVSLWAGQFKATSRGFTITFVAQNDHKTWAGFPTDIAAMMSNENTHEITPVLTIVHLNFINSTIIFNKSSHMAS